MKCLKIVANKYGWARVTRGERLMSSWKDNNVMNIVQHPAKKGIDKKSQVKRATKTTVNNEIEILKESKCHTFHD